MASFKTILSEVGTALKTFFTKDLKTVLVDATDVAEALEPAVAIAFPGISGLYNLTVNAAAKAEEDSIVAGAQSGTGAQKLALVMAAIENDFNAYWTASGHTGTPTQATIETWVNAVIAALNAIPAPASSAPTPVTQAVPTVLAAI
jgi:hypothetical protein